MEGNLGVIIWLIVMAVVFVSRQKKKQEQERARRAPTPAPRPAAHGEENGGVLDQMRKSIESLREAIEDRREQEAVPPENAEHHGSLPQELRSLLSGPHDADDHPDEPSPYYTTHPPLIPPRHHPGAMAVPPAYLTSVKEEDAPAPPPAAPSVFAAAQTQAIVQGFIWSEILDKPLALRS